MPGSSARRGPGGLGRYVLLASTVLRSHSEKMVGVSRDQQSSSSPLSLSHRPRELHPYLSGPDTMTMGPAGHCDGVAGAAISTLTVPGSSRLLGS